MTATRYDVGMSCQCYGHVAGYRTLLWRLPVSQALDLVRPTVEYTERPHCVRRFTPTDDFVALELSQYAD